MAAALHRSAVLCAKAPIKKEKHQRHMALMLFGGDKRDRTADLLTASQALSRLHRLHTPLNRVKRALQYAGNPKHTLNVFHYSQRKPVYQEK